MIAWLAQHRDALLLALRRLLSSPGTTLLSLLAMGIALALPAGGQMLLANGLRLAGDMRPTPQISLFLDLAADRKAATGIETRLASLPAIAGVRFVSREETLARMKANEGLAEVIDALPANPFPDAFILSPADSHPQAMEKLAGELRKWPKVAHVQLDSAWVQRLHALLHLGRAGVVLLAILLGVGLAAIGFNTIRLQVLTGRAEIEVSRLLGATDAFIRRPFHYFGLLQGLLGGAAAWLIVGLTTLWLRAPIGELAQLYGISFLLAPLSATDSALLLATAALLGWLGAAASVWQHLKRN